MKKEKIINDLYGKIKNIPVADSHEHLPSEEERISSWNNDIFTLLSQQYLNDDLISSGMKEEDIEKLHDVSISLEKRWKIFSPFWQHIKYGSYARSVLESLADVYGFSEINDINYQEISAKIRDYVKPGYYEKILKKKCNIKLCLNYHDYKDVSKVDRKYFIPVPHCDSLAVFNNLEALKEIESFFNCNIYSFKQYLSLLEDLVNQFKKDKIPALKFSVAYQRTLNFSRCTFFEAENVFNKIHIHYGEGISYSEAIPMQNYLIRHLVECAGKNDMTIVFHTGIQAGNRHILEDTNPALLTSLFRDYPFVRFNLFHGGIPFFTEAGLMAKYFPNVSVDMAWMHIISPEISRQSLRYWFDTVPLNKIIGFGGDLIAVENVTGHIKMAKENISIVLAEKILSGSLTEKKALNIAEKILFENPVNIFKLDKYISD